jgi:tetratricopeptide (TPR) repeat protein
MKRTQTTGKTSKEYIEEQIATLAKNPECGTTHYNLAIGLIKEQKWDEAKEELLAAVDSCPTLGEAYVALGGIHFHKGDLDACIGFNQQAIKVRPKLAPAYGNVGFAYLQKGEPHAAVEFLEKAVSINPQFVQGFCSLASAYFMLGRLEDCIAAAKKALELEPTFAVAYNNLALAYFEKGAYKEAVEHSDKALAHGFDVEPKFLEALEAYR